MPKTSWQEPERDNDHLLKLPKGRFLTPTDEVHELAPVENTTRARPVLRATSFGKTPPPLAVDMYRSRYITPSKEKDGGDATSELGTEAAVSSLEGNRGELKSYNDDAECGPVTAAERAETSSIASDEGAVSVPGTEDLFGEDELLAGKKPDTGDEPPSRSPTSTSASLRPVQTSKHRSKALRQGTETIRLHPTDPTQVIITYQVTTCTGKLFDQETEVPRQMSASASPHTGSGSIVVPSIQASKIPRSKNSSPWTPVPGSSDYEWTRDIYVNTKLLRNIDPNDKDYHAAYNKWVLQIARRQDATYASDVARVHWIAAERRALYTAINIFCTKFGIHRFGFAAECKLSTEQLQIMADAVNAVPNPSRLEPRGIDAVRSQITSAHNKSHPKNKEIFNLLAKGIDFCARMSGGEVVPGIEQKSKAAIPLSEFPVDTAVTASPTLTRAR
ncbi:hypothetical protein E8E11_005337 [Didymella keratinophila]|nr:hypothetical protein E8E11_005337 [Didymella keratinophila]